MLGLTSEQDFARNAHMVHRSGLPNGLRVITVPQPHLHSANVAVMVKVGARHETARDNGVSHLLEHMLFRGSQRYPSAYALNRAIEELGGTLHGATHADFTLFEVTLPPANVASGIEILGELFMHPSFSELPVEKRIVREEILEYLDEEGREVDPDNISRELMFGTHPLGMTITGSLANLEQLGVNELRSHMLRHYVASNMVLCVSGPVDQRAVLQAALKHFSGLRTGAPSVALPAPRPRATQPGERLRFVSSQGSQTDVRLSFCTFGANDPRYLALELLVRVIDDGMSTRLHRRICEELGLAYEVFATLEPYEEAGVLDLGGAIEHSKAPLFVRSALTLLAELCERPVGKLELDKVKRRYQWQLEASLDDAQALCAHYGQRALLGQDGHIGALREQIASVTAAELRSVAREVLCRERLHVITVGMIDRSQRKAIRRAMAKLPSRSVR
ncbi:MAG TPA: pitrilysin family protein [Polyangiales bacterium]|nr:pitrilysin family protein [Polyangiales bacterium]